MIVDTARSGAAPGVIDRIDATERPLPAALRSSTSSHAVGVGEAIELVRALGRLPSRLVVYAVEGRSFEAGAPLSPDVAAVIDAAADASLGEARGLLTLTGEQAAGTGLRIAGAEAPGLPSGP